MTSLLAHSIRLSLVLCHSGVDSSSLLLALCRGGTSCSLMAPYWTMSGRIGTLNTAGSGCVDPLGVPSYEAMVTVGRVAILLTVVGC